MGPNLFVASYRIFQAFASLFFKTKIFKKIMWCSQFSQVIIIYGISDNILHHSQEHNIKMRAFRMDGQPQATGFRTRYENSFLWCIVGLDWSGLQHLWKMFFETLFIALPPPPLLPFKGMERSQQQAFTREARFIIPTSGTFTLSKFTQYFKHY